MIHVSSSTVTAAAAAGDISSLLDGSHDAHLLFQFGR